MITKICIKNFRKLRDVTIVPDSRFNILVGDNDAGKSTVLEAISLALGGRINGRPAVDELDPHWFNQDAVAEYLAAWQAGDRKSPLEIEIEVHLEERDEFMRNLWGAHNSLVPTQAAAGVTFKVTPDLDYKAEIIAHLDKNSGVLPVEYYKIEWTTFADKALTSRPRELTIATIDARTIRSTSGIDYHLRQILNDYLDEGGKAQISLAFRQVKNEMATTHLTDINSQLAGIGGSIDGEQKISLAMDQSARAAWDNIVVPHVADVPFGLAGQGQQAVVKISLAMTREQSAKVVMIEEPENHLSHTSLNKLLRRIRDLAGTEQQLFITTHNSYVLNRLGLEHLTLINGNDVTKLTDLTPETVNYFRKLPGYDTLRMALAAKFVLVEGPSDELLFERFYLDTKGKRPIEDGLDVISMRGLSLKRCLELAKKLGKSCAAVRDNDGLDIEEIKTDLGDLIDDETRRLFVGDKTHGQTLEPQVINANPDQEQLRRVLGVTQRADLLTWMTNNKTEAAILIEDNKERLTPPPYLAEAIEFISAV